MGCKEIIYLPKKIVLKAPFILIGEAHLFLNNWHGFSSIGPLPYLINSNENDNK